MSSAIHSAQTLPRMDPPPACCTRPDYGSGKSSTTTRSITSPLDLGQHGDPQSQLTRRQPMHHSHLFASSRAPDFSAEYSSLTSTCTHPLAKQRIHPSLETPDSQNRKKDPPHPTTLHTVVGAAKKLPNQAHSLQHSSNHHVQFRILTEEKGFGNPTYLHIQRRSQRIHHRRRSGRWYAKCVGYMGLKPVGRARTPVNQ